MNKGLKKFITFYSMYYRRNLLCQPYDQLYRYVKESSHF